MKNSKPLKATKSVYAYYLPEVRSCIDKVLKKYPHDLFLESIFPGLDNYHMPVIEKYMKFQPNLDVSDYKYRYFSNGSSESIFHLLAWIKNNHPRSPIYVLKGEYEGYKAYGTNLGLTITEVPLSRNKITALKKGFWFLSNPSARNGNILKNGFVKFVCDLGHQVIYDASYVGTTTPHKFDVSHPKILAVLVSFSKPFGLFYYRVGFTFSRIELTTLYPNIWFKNVFSILIADKLVSTFSADYFYKKYKNTQKRILKRIAKETGTILRASQIYLLGYLNVEDFNKLSEKQKKTVLPFKRGTYYRFSLTPYFLDEERKRK